MKNPRPSVYAKKRIPNQKKFLNLFVSEPFFSIFIPSNNKVVNNNSYIINRKIFFHPLLLSPVFDNRNPDFKCNAV